MGKVTNPKIGGEFMPALQLKKLYYIYLSIIALFFILVLYAPVFVFGPPLVTLLFTLFFFVPLLLVITFAVYWIDRFYYTIKYKLTSNEMIWRRGVWFRNTGVVPYNRITNIDIAQGPVSRNLGIASLKIQTAGYSAPNTRSSEIKIEGMEDFEGLRETIMGFVRGRKPVAVETYDEDQESRVLNELVRIRKLLEKPRRK